MWGSTRRPASTRCWIASVILAVAHARADLGARLRRDDDPDLLDPRRHDRLDPVEEHRLVGHRHELLGARVGDGAKPRALAAGQDQPPQLVHQ
jgi:hypothetical protein